MLFELLASNVLVVVAVLGFPILGFGTLLGLLDPNHIVGIDWTNGSIHGNVIDGIGNGWQSIDIEMIMLLGQSIVTGTIGTQPFDLWLWLLTLLLLSLFRVTICRDDGLVRLVRLSHQQKGHVIDAPFSESARRTASSPIDMNNFLLEHNVAIRGDNLFGMIALGP